MVVMVRPVRHLLVVGVRLVHLHQEEVDRLREVGVRPAAHHREVTVRLAHHREVTVRQAHHREVTVRLAHHPEVTVRLAHHPEGTVRLVVVRRAMARPVVAMVRLVAVRRLVVASLLRRTNPVRRRPAAAPDSKRPKRSLSAGQR